MNDETRILSSIADLVRDVTLAVDENGCISYMNGSAKDLFGEGIGQPFNEVLGASLPSAIPVDVLFEYSFSSSENEDGKVLGKWFQLLADWFHEIGASFVHPIVCGVSEKPM